MRDIIETLQEKYNNVAKNDKAKLAKFLKRRRNELGFTLEETCEGICSTSYLSKIENCQVEVEDTYFNLLFERLNLEYKTVVEQRLIPVYPEIMEAYLKRDQKFLADKLNNIVKDRVYCDTEIELMVVVYNLLLEHYNEVQESIHKLELVKNTLTFDELLLLTLLDAIYNFKIHNLERVEKAINVLIESSTSDEVIHLVVMDLVLDYYFRINNKALFYHYYQQLLNSPRLKVFQEVEFKHHLQELVFRGGESKDLEAEFLMVKPYANETDFNKYYGLYLIGHGQDEKAYLFLKDKPTSYETLCIMGVAVGRLKNISISMEYLNILRDLEWEKNSPYFDYLEYLRLKFEQYGYSHLHMFLKQQVLPHQKKYRHSFLLDVEMQEYYQVSFAIGRYKEVVKMLLKII